jgi:hypothetical protein
LSETLFTPPLLLRSSVMPGSRQGESFTSIRTILPSIGISKRRLKQLDAIQLVREQRETGRQTLGFNARPFILCGIPLRRPPSGQLIHARRNGRFSLEITAHPRFGLPFGQDRLIPIWVATLAVRQKTRTVRFGSAAQILDFFRLPKDGPHYRRIIAGFKRVFAATIFFGTDQQTPATTVIDLARFHFFDRMQLWFKGSEEQNPPPPFNVENEIVLSEAFYCEIDEHRIPVEREAVAALAHAPGVLDFYMWLVWKSWTVKGHPARVPLVAPNGLSEQLGSVIYTHPRLFRFKIRAWLRQVRALWPECPATISSNGDSIVIQSSNRSPAIKARKNSASI